MLLVSEPLVIMPLEKRANAPSVIIPSIMLIRDNGFFSTLNDNIADSPAKKKAAEDTAPWARGELFVKMPTPIAPKAIRKSNVLTILELEARLRKYVPTSNNSPRRKIDELKTTEDGPIPRSLMYLSATL